MRQTREEEEKGRETVEAFDLLVPGLGEIIGGSAREDDLGRLEARMKEVGLDPSAYQAYLDTRRFGSLPHGGFGLGFETCGLGRKVPHIREIPPYVRAYDTPLF